MRANPSNPSQRRNLVHQIAFVHASEGPSAAVALFPSFSSVSERSSFSEAVRAEVRILRAERIAEVGSDFPRFS